MTKDSRRSTRLQKKTADILDEVARDLGIKPAAVDRQILEFMSCALADFRKPGESLSYFFYRVFQNAKHS